MIPTIDELREAWSDRTCLDSGLPHVDCAAERAFDQWFQSLLTSAYDRGYSDGFDARG